MTEIQGKSILVRVIGSRLYHSWYFKIVSTFTRLSARESTCNDFEISLVVSMPNITTNHAITYTNYIVLFSSALWKFLFFIRNNFMYANFPFHSLLAVK